MVAVVALVACFQEARLLQAGQLIQLLLAAAVRVRLLVVRLGGQMVQIPYSAPSLPLAAVVAHQTLLQLAQMVVLAVAVALAIRLVPGLADKVLQAVQVHLQATAQRQTVAAVAGRVLLAQMALLVMLA